MTPLTELHAAILSTGHRPVWSAYTQHNTHQYQAFAQPVAPDAACTHPVFVGESLVAVTEQVYAELRAAHQTGSAEPADSAERLLPEGTISADEPSGIADGGAPVAGSEVDRPTRKR